MTETMQVCMRQVEGPIQIMQRLLCGHRLLGKNKVATCSLPGPSYIRTVSSICAVKFLLLALRLLHASHARLCKQCLPIDSQTAAVTDRWQVLVHVLEVAECLHSQGLAHRALAPDTLAWFESSQRWQPASFARWAHAGSDKPLLYDLRYGAPEVRNCTRGPGWALAQRMSTWIVIARQAGRDCFVPVAAYSL